MTLAPAAPVTAHTLDVPGARLYYEVRGAGPLLVLIGSPMDANAFAPLADQLSTDHTVLTTDPRGVNRSPVDDPEQDSTPELRADDLSRLLTHIDAGPAVVFGSSGGAVTALALAQTHPEQVARDHRARAAAGRAARRPHRAQGRDRRHHRHLCFGRIRCGLGEIPGGGEHRDARGGRDLPDAGAGRT